MMATLISARFWSLLLFSLISSTHAEAKSNQSSGIEDQLKMKAGDEAGNEVKALKTEMLVMSSNKKALSQLLALKERYSKTAPNKKMEQEILYRLGEEYMNRARNERFFEVHKNSDEVMSFVPQLVKDASESKQIHEAIHTYTFMQEKYPHFYKMDIVLYNTAYAYQQIGDDKNAEAQLTKLITEHPTSPMVPDAYLNVGEIRFSKRDFSGALANFKEIRRFPQARVYPYGLYKAAWAYYNMQDADSGLKQLEEVVAFGSQIAQTHQDSKLDLRKEALGDMALFFGDVKKSSEAVSYFRIQASDLDPIPTLMRLVSLYKLHSAYKDIEVVLKDVLKTFPDSVTAAQAHEELAWNFERMKMRKEAGEELQAFDQWCDTQIEKAGPPKKGQANSTLECREKIVDASKKLSLKWHGAWKKQGGPDDLVASAEDAYRLYLKHASLKDEERPAVRYSFSELLFARQKFRESSESYAMLEFDSKQGAKVDSKIAHDAAYGAVVALEKANGDKWSDTDEARFDVLADSYVARFPSGAYALDLRFKHAFIAYEKERYDEAAPMFKAIGWTAVSANQASLEKIVKSQDLYLDILNIKKDYKGIKEATKHLLDKNRDSARSVQIEKIYREAYFSEIQQTEVRGEFVQAAAAYKKFALENTSSDLAPKAWWNASQIQFRIGDAQGGAQTCYQMAKLFSKSGTSKECLTKAAQTFEAMARLDLAARVLLNLALLEPSEQDHWREVAADFFAVSRETERAITMYQKLADDRKDKTQQAALLEKAASLARDSGDNATLGVIEARFSRDGVEPQAGRLVVEQAEQAFRQQDFTKAFNLSKRVISRESLPKELLARARFVQAEVLDDEYRRQSVKARLEKVGTVLALKTEKLEKAQKAYQSAANYGDPAMSVKSLQHLALAYLDYAKSVRSMELKGLSDADIAAFRQQTEQLATPIEEKGIEAMGQALAAAKKAQLRDGQIAELKLEVNRLNMKTEGAAAVTVVPPAMYVPKLGSTLTLGRNP